MFKVIMQILKAAIRSQSRLYWALFLATISLQLFAFFYVLPYGFWYAIAVATILNWVSVAAINRCFNWDAYIDALYPEAKPFDKAMNKVLIKAITKK